MTAIRGLNPHYRLLAPTVHGGGRRPEKPFTVDPAELKEWNRCQGASQERLLPDAERVHEGYLERRLVMRPRLLELFCGAMGSGVGYARAGFDVVGVDIDPHPDAPFRVVEADALQVLTDAAFLGGFDVIHAGPPCQRYTTMSNRHRGQGGKADSHPDLISWVRLGLQAWGGPYVIENVPGARREMRNVLRLRGGMFGLGVDRPRLFESNVDLGAPPPVVRVANPIGVYGKHHDGRRLFTRKDGSVQRAASSLEEAQRAMGIDWMGWDDLREAVPPAYTEYLGTQLLAHLESEAAA